MGRREQGVPGHLLSFPMWREVARGGKPVRPGPNACASCPTDEPGSWSAPAAASPGLPEVGVSLEDVLSPFSPSHPAPPSDPSHQTNPDPTWDIKREHDVRKPKELSAGSQKKQRLGEQSERSASPQRAVQPGLEEAPGGQGQPEAGRPSSETRAPGPALAEAARAGNKEGLQAPVGSELGRHGGPGAAPAFVGPGGRGPGRGAGGVQAGLAAPRGRPYAQGRRGARAVEGAGLRQAAGRPQTRRLSPGEMSPPPRLNTCRPFLGSVSRRFNLFPLSHA